jgi:hypothetical protein
VELIAFEPLDGADNQYGQIHRKISDHPYKEASIKGFTPPNPFRVSTNFVTTSDALAFRWPTLAELNDELCPYPCSHNEEFNQYISEDGAWLLHRTATLCSTLQHSNNSSSSHLSSANCEEFRQALLYLQ